MDTAAPGEAAAGQRRCGGVGESAAAPGRCALPGSHLTAVSQDGRARRPAAQELRADREAVHSAVFEDSRALQPAAKELRADLEVITKRSARMLVLPSFRRRVAS